MGDKKTNNRVVWYKNDNGLKEGVCNTLDDLLHTDLSSLKIGSIVIVGGGSYGNPTAEFPLDAKVFMLFPPAPPEEGETGTSLPQWKEL